MFTAFTIVTQPPLTAFSKNGREGKSPDTGWLLKPGIKVLNKLGP